LATTLSMGQHLNLIATTAVPHLDEKTSINQRSTSKGILIDGCGSSMAKFGNERPDLQAGVGDELRPGVTCEEGQLGFAP
jgi:hypothetical protein